MCAEKLTANVGQETNNSITVVSSRGSHPAPWLVYLLVWVIRELVLFSLYVQVHETKYWHANDPVPVFLYR